MRHALLLYLLLACGCGVLLWDSVYRSDAPDGKSTLQLQVRSCGPDCEIRIVVGQWWRTTEIARRGDCVLEFAHVAWLGSVVSVFVDGVTCGQLRAAYDVAAERAVPFEETESWLADSIVKEYSVTNEEIEANAGDVFKWASYFGNERPRRSHREFRRRYRK